MRKEKKEFLIGDVMGRSRSCGDFFHLNGSISWLQRFYTYLRKVPVATISCS